MWMSEDLIRLICLIIGMAGIVIQVVLILKLIVIIWGMNSNE